MIELFKNIEKNKRILLSKTRYKGHKIYIICESRHKGKKIGKMEKK